MKLFDITVLVISLGYALAAPDIVKLSDLESKRDVGIDPAGRELPCSRSVGGKFSTNKHSSQLPRQPQLP